jgi:hypothetical protein
VIQRFILGLLVALISITAQAQGSWTAWVYSTDGSVVRVSAQGAIIDAYTLPLNPAFNAYGPSALVSPNGRFIAYTTADTITGLGNQQLFVYDTQAGIIRFTYDLTGVDTDDLSFAQYPHSTAFDEGAQTLAFGLVRGGEWELVVANLATESLSGGAPLTAADVDLEGGNALPVPEIVNGNAVRFFLLPAGSNFREYPAYLWTPGQTVSEVGASSPYSAVLPGSGEIATPVHDDTLDSAATPEGAALAYNAIYIVQNGRSFFLHDPNIDISRVWWIGGGSQLLLQGFDQTLGGDVLKVYGRDGTLTGQFSGALGDIHGTPEGFAGLFPSGGGLGLAHVETGSGTFTPATIWTTADASARLIHVQP